MQKELPKLWIFSHKEAEEFARGKATPALVWRSLIIMMTSWDEARYIRVLEQNPKAAAEIEMAIREKAGLISKKIEGNPIEKEKVAVATAEEEVPSKKN